MSMELAFSPWLSDWRAYADETEMSPKARRKIEAAIRNTSQQWEDNHAQAYRGRLRQNRDKRNEQVVGACDSLIEELDDMISDLRNGRLTAAEAKSQWRSMVSQMPRIIELHDTLVEEDKELASFAEMTADEYQKLQVATMPVLKTSMPSLVAALDQMDNPSAETGTVATGAPSDFARVGFTPVANPPGDGAPSVDDIRAR